ncbi:DUF2125 domain-containing protein [Thalassorhabdomicrobium marinisediminis]|uniref:DUF2125 domain-containing protein n=1 Tax=Thalassorhabdomicrobium marinisediminis TaxID=2170577 RepID=A0A2T7FUM4_9RHOB|nr:DUF2125 domain-containing protein [Thalassorhabdomicrobium marinisediminis]PVA05864.1 DUF2125 domain-containing protein [Thalassorhabdomicrobium marinisediminis]
MRKLIALVVILATLYGGYWFIGRAQVQSRLTEALAQIDAGATEISYDDLSTRGFPSRFDTTITNLTVADPTAGVRWETPIFQLLALSYRPNNVRAHFPEEQVFTLDGERFTLLTEEMVARGQVSPSTTLPFQQAELELVNPRLRTEEGAEISLARLFAAMRLAPDTDQTYDAFFEARSLALPDYIRRLADPQNLQPPMIQSLRLDADIDLDAPIALNADVTMGRIETLSIRELALDWGEISLSAIGDLTPDEMGRINGSVTLAARNWSRIFDLLIAAGVVSGDSRELYTTILNGLDETPHIPDTLTATLAFDDGVMTLGPLPLGEAPRLR